MKQNTGKTFSPVAKFIVPYTTELCTPDETSDYITLLTASEDWRYDGDVRVRTRWIEGPLMGSTLPSNIME